MTITLLHGDCLTIMPTLPAGSVDAIITDPPYYRIMRDDWDNQWGTLDDYLEWIDALAVEWRRLLKPNGSLYVFADDKVAAYVQVTLDKRFLLLNNLVWYKTNGFTKMYAQNMRSYAPMTERILFYSAQYDPTGWETVKLDVNNFKPLREYFRQYQEALGLSIKQINTLLGHRRAEHGFYWNSTQWDLPTPETYAELAKLPVKNEFVRREYEDLRREYEDLRREYEDLRREYEDLRRTFHADTTTHDVISGPIVGGRENTSHPTTKPIWIMRKLIEVSTNEGDTILDCCMGSGTTGVAAWRTGRNFIGIEMDKTYFDMAEERLRIEQQQPMLFSSLPKRFEGCYMDATQ